MTVFKERSWGTLMVRGALAAAGVLVAFLVPAASPARPSAAKPVAPTCTLSNGVETCREAEGAVQLDRTGKGAILCSWGILEAVRAAGRACFKNQDQAFQSELDQSLSRIDQFIIRNSSRPVTQAALEARRAQALEELRSAGDICTGDAARMYQDMRIGGAAQLRAGTAELLSIPREPVMNPCL